MDVDAWEDEARIASALFTLTYDTIVPVSIGVEESGRRKKVANELN